MNVDPCPKLYPQVNCQSIPVGHLPLGILRVDMLPMDIQDVRHANLHKVLARVFGGKQRAMADAVGVVPNLLSRILGGKKIEDSIRKWEAALGYAPGSLDRTDFDPLGSELWPSVANQVREPGAHYWIDSDHSSETKKEKSTAFPGPDRFTLYPIIGTVPCGDFREAIESARNDPDTKWQPSTKRLPGGGFFLRAKGTSMEPTIQDGDLVLIHPGAVPEHKKIVAVRNGSAESTLKRLVEEGGVLMLVPDNRQFQAAPLGDKEILGVVVQIARDV